MRTLLPLLLLSGCSEFELIKEPMAPTPAPSIRVEPAALSFRSSPLSETQVELVHIHNDGDAALSLDTLWIEGAGLDSFTLDRDLGGTVLLPGEQRDVGVLFTPDRTDPAAMLQIGSDDPGVAVWPVPLSGAGAVGALLLTPNPLDLGYADPGEQTTGTLYVRNVGLDTVTLTETYT
jgi:hypothetical protein